MDAARLYEIMNQPQHSSNVYIRLSASVEDVTEQFRRMRLAMMYVPTIMTPASAVVIGSAV